MEHIDVMIKAVQDYVRRCMAPFGERLKALEDRPEPKDGAPGECGADGINGKDGAAGTDGKDGEPGRDGVDGKDGGPGKDGKDGAAGTDGKDGSKGEPGEKGGPGERGEKGEPGINGKDGGPGESGQDGQPGTKGDPGLDGRDGIEGEPGKDALHVDVVMGIEPQRKYQRGTWASYKGGLFRSFRATDPLGDDWAKAGWECIVNGIDTLDAVLGDDMRTLGLTIRCSNGAVVEKSAKVPGTIYRGIWRDDEKTYSRGDSATRDGSTWVLMADEQKGKPGDEGSGWVLSVKRGRDGLRGEKGERGAEGRAASRTA